jgi:hypothetical protein
MATIRHGLRVYVTAWLAIQAVALSALLPWACCCIPDRPAAPARPACHQEAAPAVPAAPADNEATHDACSMRSGCDNPLEAILEVLSNQGPAAERGGPSIDLEWKSVTPPSTPDTLARLSPPDPPPPRA